MQISDMRAENGRSRFQQQIEAIRREAFEEGHAAAMKAVGELASRTAPQSHGGAAAPSRNQSEPRKAASPLRTSTAVRRSPADGRTRAVARITRRSRGRRAERGANARMIQEVLKKAAPRAVRQADIRNALQKKGISLTFPSIRHALGQLEARRAAKQVRNSRTWRSAASA